MCESSDNPPPKRRIYTEEAKQRQVTHWDLDYLPRDEVERAQDEAAEPTDSGR